MNTENKIRRNNIVAAVATLLAVGSLVYLSVEIGKNNKLEESLNKEKLATETFLSEKLSLEKELNRLREDLKSLDAKNAKLDELLASTSVKLDESEKQLSGIKRNNASIADLKKQNQELRRLKEELEQQIALIRDVRSQLEASINDMERNYALLQAENKKLRDELAVAKTNMDNVLVVSSKRNNKQTISAKRARKLMAEIDVPAHVNNLRFKIYSPDGEELAYADSEVSVKVVNGDPKSQAVYATTTSSSPGQQIKRVAMEYSPKKRLKAGTYKIDVFHDSVSIGSLQVKFR